MSLFTVGIIAIVAIVVFTYLGFSKFSLPFQHQFTVHALFPSSSGLRQDSLVRIAGVNVGKVSSIQQVSGKQLSEVSMTIDDNGLPIHQDATFAIRPRIFLEGNFFVDVNPGTPSSPIVKDGHTFSPQQGTYPVQLDQLLGSLQANTRQNLQILLKEFGGALAQAAPSYNASIPYWYPAYKYSAIVNHDFLGTQPHDLSNYIGAMADVSGALDTHPQNLQSLITDFNTTANAFARQSTALQSAVAELPRTLAAATPALNALNAAFPPLREFARTLDPGVRNSGPTIDASIPFITQLNLLARPQELRGLTADLAVAIPSLAKLTEETIPLMRDQVRPASSCVANEVLPWTHLTVPDPNFGASNGFPPHPVYVEGVDFLPGLAGESRVFDANGPYVRILLGSGTLTYSLAPGLFGQALAPIVSETPQVPPSGKRPPLAGGDIPNYPCETQPAITDLTAKAGAPPSAIDTGAGKNASSQAFEKAQAEVGLRQLRKQLNAEHSSLRINDPVYHTGVH